MKLKFLITFVMVLSMLFASACAETTTGSHSKDSEDNSEDVASSLADEDTSLFPFNDAAQVGLCFSDMRYPFEESQNYVQIFAGNDQSNPNLTYTVDGKLTVKMSDSLNSYSNVCFRVYSPEFDDKEIGSTVKVSVKIAIPDTTWNVFFAVRDENGKEKHVMKLPKNGVLETYSWTTQIENSDAFYFNQPTSFNNKNIQFAFFRLAAGDMFEIDSIDFQFD